MSHERPTHPSDPKPYELFGFTEQEALDGRVSHERFQEILQDEQTAEHSAEESYNNYGEFLYLTLSRLLPAAIVCHLAESRARLPELYSSEEQGLDALAQIKFFTPDSSWSWHASEFDSALRPPFAHKLR